MKLSAPHSSIARLLHVRRTKFRFAPTPAVSRSVISMSLRSSWLTGPRILPDISNAAREDAATGASGATGRSEQLSVESARTDTASRRFG